MSNGATDRISNGAMMLIPNRNKNRFDTLRGDN